MHPLAEMFGNRLRKNLRRLQPWARQRGVALYRLYDRDIPEVGLAVDRYQDRLHVAEYHKAAFTYGPDGEELTDDPLDDASPHDAADAEAPDPRHDHAGFLRDVLQVLASECKVPAPEIYLKQRQRQRGAAQYQRLAESGHEIAVPEDGLRFLVNLQDYLDTGLFLDHRDTRRLVGTLARGQRVLNLFSYTGSFTVYAGRGGAASTTSVDLSRTYLEWAARNLRKNDLNGREHALVYGDARLFLAAGPPGDHDLIVLDPPTFSNSKRMDGVLDIQRDHAALLRGALRRLSRDGVLLFSSNFRRLRFLDGDPAQLPGARVTEISEHTVPFDFKDRRVHRCWLVQHQRAATSASEIVHLLYSRPSHA